MLNDKEYQLDDIIIHMICFQCRYLAAALLYKGGNVRNNIEFGWFRHLSGLSNVGACKEIIYTNEAGGI